MGGGSITPASALLNMVRSTHQLLDSVSLRASSDKRSCSDALYAEARGLSVVTLLAVFQLGIIVDHFDKCLVCLLFSTATVWAGKPFGTYNGRPLVSRWGCNPVKG